MLELAIRAARAAGAVLAESYGQPHRITVKGLRDITTDADLAAEEAAVSTILAAWPDARILSEESHHQPSAGDVEPAWYIDPLDGTSNYARGLPMFSVSVALVEAGRSICGAVYDPLLDQLFTAERGRGAYLGARRLEVSPCADLADSLVTLDWPRDQAIRERAARFLARLAPQVDAVRSRGSAALGLCAVAAGWTDAYFQYTLSPWDTAAGALIVEEAGGCLTDLSGQPFALHKPDWLVTNGRIHQAILALGPLEA